jgi:hypothetical protein
LGFISQGESLRKVGAARRAARYRATRRVAPTIGFARLAYGAFYFAIPILTSYEIINIEVDPDFISKMILPFPLFYPAGEYPSAAALQKGGW